MHRGRIQSRPAAYCPSFWSSVVRHDRTVPGQCGWLRGQLVSRPSCLTPPCAFSPQLRGLQSFNLRCEALSSGVSPTKAYCQGGENDAVEETLIVRTEVHLEGQGDGLFEQEAEGPLHDQVGGRQTEAAEAVASIKEALRKIYPKRRDISPATTAFIGTLLRIGLTKPEICRMFRMDRNLFARSSEAFLEQRKLLARHGVSAAGFRALLQRGTWWLCKPLRDVESTILYVENLLGGPREAAVRVFTVYPPILNCSVANLEEKVQALQQAGVRDVGKVTTKYPVALLYTAQEIAAKAAALKLAVGTELATALLERRPALLRVNTDVLREQLAWLEKTFGRAIVLQMVRKDPRVLGAKVETASAAYAGLVGTFGEAHARRMLLVHPGLLQVKWCTVDAKLDFLTKELGHTLDEVASCARVLMAGLEGRLRPRAAALQAAGKAYSSLSSLARYSDKQFERVYGVCLRQTAVASSEAETWQRSGEKDQPHSGSIR